LQKDSLGKYKGSLWGKKVAIKRLKFSSSISSDEQESLKIIRKLKEEAAIMSSIRHPNVLLFMGLCSTPPNICLVTEFMENGSLYEVLQSRVVSDKILFRMLTDICYGVNYLHNKSVLHLDLKPLNLLVDENLSIKVADFGISRITQGIDKKIKGPQGYGTVLYMPPEVIMGSVDDSTYYDYTYDVFSFGVMLFEILYMREHPDINFAVQDTIGYDLLREPLMNDQLPLLPPWWPTVFSDLIIQCTDNDPKKRPPFSTILQHIENIDVSGEWFILRACTAAICQLASDKENHQSLLDHNVWDTLNFYLDHYSDDRAIFLTLCAMIDLAPTKPNVTEMLNIVIEKMHQLAFDPCKVETGTSLMKEPFAQIVSDIGELRYFLELQSSYSVGYSGKDLVLKILNHVMSDGMYIN
jgi:serine/threonine protein kinase